MIDSQRILFSEIWDWVKYRANTKIREGQSTNDISTSTHTMTDWFWENRPKRGKHFFSISRRKALWVNFFQIFFMAEMDRHQLALAYSAVISSGEI